MRDRTRGSQQEQNSSNSGYEQTGTSREQLNERGSQQSQQEHNKGRTSNVGFEQTGISRDQKNERGSQQSQQERNSNLGEQPERSSSESGLMQEPESI